MGRFVGRFRFHDRPISLDAAPTADASLFEQWCATKEDFDRCNESYQSFLRNNRKPIDPDGPHAAPERELRKRVEEARERMRRAEFLAFDHAMPAVTHSQKLAFINRRNAEFWEGRAAE